MGQGDTLLNAVIGAVVTVVASFIPFSPVFGGAVAALLQKEDSGAGIKVGAIAGLLSLIPFILVILLLGSFLPFIPAMGGPGAAAGIAGIALVLVLVVGVVYTVGLGALGGYLGWYIESETDLL